MAEDFNRKITQVQQANDIIDVVGEHVNLSRRGREMVGLCPFHDDHKPSMYVSNQKQIFKCFACGAGGDVFKFIQMRENLTFPQAVKRLAERAGIEIEFHRRSISSGGKPEIDPNRLAKANKWACDRFRENLRDENKGRPAREYLKQRRVNSESIEKWQLGVALEGNCLLEKAQSCNAPIEILSKAGLVTGRPPNQRDKFANRLMFPITDVSGRVIGFGGRTLGNDKAKYINSPASGLFNKSNCIYGLEQARHSIVSSGTAVVVEGYTDVIMAHQYGCENVVATLGTSFTEGHGRILKRYGQQIVLIFDSDVAGLEAANRAMEVCLSQRIDIKVASVDRGKDPCDFLLSEGKEGFENLIANAIDVFEFKWNRLMDKFNRDKTFEGRKRAIDEFLESVAAGLTSGNLEAVHKGLIINRLASVIGIEGKELNSALNEKLRRLRQRSNYHKSNQQVKSIDLGKGLYAGAQREICEVLLNKPELAKQVWKKIERKWFDVPALRKVIDLIFEVSEKDKNPGLTDVLSRIESPEFSSKVIELAESGEEKGNYQARINDATATMKRIRQRISEQRNSSEYLESLIKNGGQNPYSIGLQ